MGFSVLMSVYCKEKPEFLKTAIISVINQSLVPDEIVLIEDGPLTEKLYNVIELLKKDYPILKTYKIEENLQLGRALAKGVELCNHELIARMDTDDIAVNTRFETQYQYMHAHPEISAVGGFIEEFSEKEGTKNIKKVPIEEKDIHKYLKYRNPLNHMTVMFRKSAVLAVGNYVHFPFLEDYYLWNRLYANGQKLGNIPKVLVYARVSQAMYKRRGGIKYGIQYLRLRKLQKELNVTNRMEFLLGCILSLAISFQPSRVREWIYSNILRRSK